ncbi:flagellar brake protein [uncultured Marinococcus sp.]|uniref:flagellar brake protein n=1 Tax=uncultured Marinococcus sp. TaxID=487012 RepID=UPI00262402C5|nr:PilZ domain-containing protein [uncultured Marinococcus sp.]
MYEIGSVWHLHENIKTKAPHDNDIQYKSQLLDADEHTFTIAMPSERETGKITSFHAGRAVHVWFVGEDSAVYSFRSTVLSRQKGHIPALIIERPAKKEWQRVQRRNYVRVETSVNAAVHGHYRPFTTVTVNVSGGGCMIVVPPKAKLLEDEQVQITLAFPMEDGAMHYLHCTAAVRRVLEKEERRPKRASMEFLDLAEKERQAVIRYCFERQRAAANQEKRIGS